MENKIMDSQCKRSSDRRKQDFPVAVERRDGLDRRNLEKINIDANENEDVFASFRKSQPICVTPLGIVQPIDKVEDIQDCIKEKNYLKAIGVGLILINTFGKDALELKNFRDDFIKIIKNKKLTYEDYQVSHSFIENTEIDKMQLFEPLRKIDKTIFDLKFGELILKKFGMTAYKEVSTGICDKVGEPIYKTKIIGNKFVEVLGRAFLRTPVFGIGVLSLLEIPAIAKEKKHKKEQILKSTIGITSITSCSAILGAIGAYYPPLGFIGAGLGAYLGYKMSDYINKKILD